MRDNNSNCNDDTLLTCIVYNRRPSFTLVVVRASEQYQGCQKCLFVFHCLRAALINVYVYVNCSVQYTPKGK
jgi:hypothetical protein